jgi:ADP-heptose:LPS heptosyltransferase
MRELHADTAARFLLFWAPGAEDDPRHPGDDGKADRIRRSASDIPLEPIRTSGLGALLEGLARCDAVICADGGVMHLAAALHKPIACLFGVTDPSEWRPWGVPHRLVQPPSKDVQDATTGQMREAFLSLARETGLAP